MSERKDIFSKSFSLSKFYESINISPFKFSLSTEHFEDNQKYIYLCEYGRWNEKKCKCMTIT